MNYIVRNVANRLDWHKIVLKMSNGKSLWITWDCETKKDESLENRNLQVSEVDKEGLKSLLRYDNEKTKEDKDGVKILIKWNKKGQNK